MISFVTRSSPGESKRPVSLCQSCSFAQAQPVVFIASDNAAALKAAENKLTCKAGRASRYG